VKCFFKAIARYKLHNFSTHVDIERITVEHYNRIKVFIIIIGPLSECVVDKTFRIFLASRTAL